MRYGEGCCTQDVGNSQNVGAGSASIGGSIQDEEACCIVLAHLLVDMWQHAGPATSFSLACVLLKRHSTPSLACPAATVQHLVQQLVRPWICLCYRPGVKHS